ncbi:MAG: response regulator [Calditrichaeota bacterium]|nr:MAG: response regulator [Calditrichota bacterium]
MINIINKSASNRVQQWDSFMSGFDSSTANLLLDNIEGPHLLLEFFASFSKRIFEAKDFKTILNQLVEDLRKIYPRQQIEFILWQDQEKWIKFQYQEASKELLPQEDLSHQNTIYNHVIEQEEIVLTNDYPSYCEKLGLDDLNLPAHSWIGLPVKVRGKVIGALILWDESHQHYLHLQDKHFLQTVINILSFAVENVYLYDYIIEHHETNTPLPESFLKVISPSGSKQLIKELLEWICVDRKLAYTGVFLKNGKQFTWKKIYDVSSGKTPQRDTNLLEFLNQIDQHRLLNQQYIYWNTSQPPLPVLKAPSELFHDDNISFVLLLPFTLEDNHQGIWMVLGEHPLLDPDGKRIQLYFLLLQIITQLLNKNLLKLKLRKMVNQPVSRTSKVTDNSAHKLNNIFGILLGKLQLLQLRIKDESARNELEVLIQTAQQGIDTVRRVLTPQEQNIDSESFTEININHILQEAINIIRPRFDVQTETRGIHYELHLELGKVSPSRGNAEELREAFLNLFTNALDAMPRGGTLTVQSLQKNDTILIFIKDTGIGIPFHLHEKIFEPAFTTKGKDGNGFGLSIVKETIQEHGGQIFVDSAPQKGAIFMIELPIVQSPPLQLNPYLNGYSNHPPIRRILLVESEDSGNQSLKTLLSEEGFTITEAQTTHEALFKLQKYGCELVLSDTGAQESNSIHLASMIKRIKPEIPFILISSANQIDASLLDSNTSIDAILRKPLQIDELRTTLHRFISHNGNSRSSNGSIG